MQRTYGLDSAVKLDDEIYHVETYAEPKFFKVISQVFKSGKILEMKEHPYDENITEKSLLAMIQSIHNRQIDGLSHLLHLAEKVRKELQAAAFNRIGELFLKKGFYQDAQRSFEEAIKSDQNLTDAHRNLGTIFKKLGYVDRAIAQFTRALYLAPNNADYYLDLGLAYIEKDMYDEAFKELKKAININNDYADAYFNLGLLILKEKVVKQKPPNEQDVQAVKFNFKSASILDSRYQVKQYHEACNLLLENDYAEALKLFDKFKSGMQKIDVHEFISDFELFSKFSDLRGTPITIDEYLDKMNTKIEKYPIYADLRNALGKAYLIKIRSLFDAAVKQFKKALEINPEYGEVKNNLELLENETKGFILFLRAILK
jgi:tetratricopeptide (TPR) repeat protein